MLMSFTELERQALGSIADGLAGSDPRLAAALILSASGPTTCARSMGTACPSPSITRMSARANADAPRAVSMSMNAKGAGRA
jgi:hypothetical protein